MSKVLAPRALSVVAAAAALSLVPTTFAQAAEFTPRPNADGRYVQRIWGVQASDTSVFASKEAQQDGLVSQNSTVYLVGGRAFNYPDALALTPLADATDSPVLMLDENSNLPVVVRDELKRLAPAHVTVIGGSSAVPASTLAAVQAALPNAVVTRIAGSTAEHTAYKLAGEATAYLQGTDMQDYRDDIYDVEQREARYQAALAAYEKARAEYATALANYNTALAQHQALQARIVELSNQLETVNGPTQAEIDAAQAEVFATNERLKVAQSDWDLFTKTLGADQTTLDVKATLGQYKTAFPGLANRISQAQTRVGATDATTLEEAIVLATQRVDAIREELKDDSDNLAELLAARIRAAAASAHNKPILDQIGQLQIQLEALQARLVTLSNILEEKWIALERAQEALARATYDRPNPGDLDYALKQYDDALEKAIRNGGNNSVFLATSRHYADALAAGPAAGELKGVVLLSEGDNLGSWATRYLAQSGAQVLPVGGPAVRAANASQFKDRIGEQFLGNTLYDTAALVTEYAFARNGRNTTAHPIVIASGEVHYDAVIGGSYAANSGGGILFVQKSDIPVATANYVSNISDDHVFITVLGGQARIDQGVVNQLATWNGSVMPIQP